MSRDVQTALLAGCTGAPAGDATSETQTTTPETTPTSTATPTTDEEPARFRELFGGGRLHYVAENGTLYRITVVHVTE